MSLIKTTIFTSNRVGVAVTFDEGIKCSGITTSDVGFISPESSSSAGVVTATTFVGSAKNSAGRLTVGGFANSSNMAGCYLTGVAVLSG